MPKVDAFLNHQLRRTPVRPHGFGMGRSFRRQAPSPRFLTIEASGIGIACVAAQHFGNVPVVFAKKAQSINL